MTGFYVGHYNGHKGVCTLEGGTLNTFVIASKREEEKEHGTTTQEV